MAENSKIEWTDHTHNFWVGCTKVSSACDHCYAENWAKRTGHPGLWGGERRRTTAANWRKPIKWNAEAGATRPRMFTNSLADFFDNRVPAEWRTDAWALIRATSKLDWLILTKRPQNISKMLPPGWGGGWPNVWLGTTAENQEEANRRIPYLLVAPAAVRFLSCEPLLGPLAIRHHWLNRPHSQSAIINWIICGGESGGNAREMSPAWARLLRDDCRAEGVPFFLKQMTRKAPIPPDLMVREFPR